MSDFGGVFEVLAASEEDVRLSSRKALLLSEQRVNERLGKWLSQANAQTFDSVFSYTKDEFEGIVAQACEETGHGNPEAIAKTLEAHYRPLADKKKLPWDDDDDDSDEDENEDPASGKKSSTRTARRPRMCPYHNEVVDISLGSAEPQAGYNAMAQHAWGANHCQGGEYAGGKCNFKREMVTQSYWDDRQKNLDEKRELRQEQMGEVPLPQDTFQEEMPEDTIDQELVTEPTEELSEGFDGSNDTMNPIDVEPISEFTMAMASNVSEVTPLKEERDEVPDRVSASPKDQENNPSDQRDESGKQVPCPQCGGDGKTSNNQECSKCKGGGKVSDWGPSTLDNLNSKVAGDGDNTGLGGPSPKIDKSKWTPETVKKYDEESKEHPTKEKDPVVPIKAKNDDELEEIGEKTTERVDLPAGSEDKGGGFADGGETKGDKTKTYPKGKKEVDPVTKESISHAGWTR